ncbi:aquaporin-1-like [Arachis ipaensis]|uniref:Aquaporin n=1 Tax=Arachis hypogaea TaxID=3818 RepID=A0A445A7V9_ARAHY|nr:aquaporin-1-like [Arachis ipaensis]XP_025642693.1 aquaporin-1 isoform X1 [Arachis hypogaea]QHN99507.1 Aquaporin [Arachis hypogaea]RYR22445.1 hypothetical protein Ahy_B03g067729 [Arachis hypogaea]
MASFTVQTDKVNTLDTNKSSKSNFLSFIGAHEIFMPLTWVAALRELVLNYMLMFMQTGSIIRCLDSNEVDPKLLVPVVIFFLLLLLLNTIPFFEIHMSSTVTVIAILKNVITITRGLMYIIAQCIGSIIGFIILKYVMNPKLQEKYSLESCAIGDDHNIKLGSKPLVAFFIEFSFTSLVLFTLGFDKKKLKKLGLPKVLTAGALALTTFVSIIVSGYLGYAGVGFNPTSCLGPFAEKWIIGE